MTNLEKFNNAGLRCELDRRNEKVGYKMRDAQIRKIPYILVIGDQEVENDTITYRKHGEEE